MFVYDGDVVCNVWQQGRAGQGRAGQGRGNEGTHTVSVTRQGMQPGQGPLYQHDMSPVAMYLTEIAWAALVRA
jgi:hypothetical protein